MKAAPLTCRPDFRLMTQNDIQSYYHLQMPRWLFDDQRYRTLSLEAKVAYTLLLNRFQLSRLNGWVNDTGEVFIIYTRASLAEELQVSYHKVIDAMKELSAARLIWEKRCGRGDANQIYLARVELEEPVAASAPFVAPGDEAAGGRSAENTYQGAGPATPAQGMGGHSALSRSAETAHQEVPNGQVQTCTGRTSGPAGEAHQEVRQMYPSKIDSSKTKRSPKEVSQPVGTDDGGLDLILRDCHLELFDADTAHVFAAAIERLYYSESFRIGNAVLPQARVRSRLYDLDYTLLCVARQKLRANMREVKNSTAYVMSVIFNAITEAAGDTLVDPYLNSLQPGPPAPGEGGVGFVPDP